MFKNLGIVIRDNAYFLISELKKADFDFDCIKNNDHIEIDIKNIDNDEINIINKFIENHNINADAMAY